ncbi:hydrogenase maturation protease [bacterium]|nr:hydrogenase maturation protease [bacterium]
MTGTRQKPILVLALGNDILGDDGIAFYAARALQEEFSAVADFTETAEAGLALMEMLEGYEYALLMDSVMTGQCDPGTIVEFQTEQFKKVVAPSPHYAGLPEVLELSARLGLDMPTGMRILAMEVADPFTLREELTPDVARALPNLVDAARAILEEWRASVPCTNTH